MANPGNSRATETAVIKGSPLFRRIRGIRRNISGQTTYQGFNLVVHPHHLGLQNASFINFEDGATIKSAEAMSVLLAETHRFKRAKPKSQTFKGTPNA